MVDLRPLLFINLLLAMTLVTAGFARLNSDDLELAGSDVPPVWSESTPDAAQEDDSASVDMAKSSEKPASDNTFVDEQAEQNGTADAIEDEALFAKEEATEPEPEAPAQETVAESEPQIIQPVQVEPKPVTTGSLIVKSNVYQDMVLVDGKPYGSTRLALELTPGTYHVEVAKHGYDSWTSSVDVRRGSKQTLNARLERYTKVSYHNGSWEHDVTTGEGSYREDGQLEYNGSFVNGKFHGVGTARYATGMKYQGEWFEGMMKGEGTLTTIEGDTYVGEMEDNKFNGEGTLTKATGDIYTGFWIDGMLNGQGSLTTKDGLLFVGGFADNLFHGSGSLTYPDGGHYEGSFSNGLFHGKGVEVYADGKKYVGQFIEGLYHGKGELLNPNGSKITGTFKDGKPFGKATLTTAEGEVFTARSSEPGVCYRLKSYRATECPKLEGW